MIALTYTLLDYMRKYCAFLHPFHTTSYTSMNLKPPQFLRSLTHVSEHNKQNPVSQTSYTSKYSYKSTYENTSEHTHT